MIMKQLQQLKLRMFEYLVNWYYCFCCYSLSCCCTCPYKLWRHTGNRFAPNLATWTWTGSGLEQYLIIHFSIKIKKIKVNIFHSNQVSEVSKDPPDSVEAGFFCYIMLQFGYYKRTSDFNKLISDLNILFYEKLVLLLKNGKIVYSKNFCSEKFLRILEATL